MKMRPRWVSQEPIPPANLKNEEFDVPVEDTRIAPPLPEPPVIVQPMVWTCIDCANRVTKMHKGTGYCDQHYHERNLYGKLIS